MQIYKYLMDHIDYIKFKKEFLESELGMQVAKDFDQLSCNDEHFPSILLVAKRFKSTVREVTGSTENLEPVVNNRQLSIVSFFYLRYLTETKPEAIYDLGCGWNLWKRYIPEIIGVDHRSNYADLSEDYDENFWKKHKGSLPSILSINMNRIAFDSSVGKDVFITLKNIGTVIKTFAELLKSGGRGYVSIPLFFIYRQTPDSWFEKNNIIKYDMQKIKSHLNNVVDSLPCKVLACDIEVDIFKNRSDHDGDFRIVFEV